MIIERSGMPMAVFIGIDEYKRLIAAQAREREARFKRLLAIAVREQNVSPEQVEADVAEAVAVVRGGEQ